MAFSTKGTIVELYDVQQISDRFKKRELVLEVKEGMYPEFVKFQMTQDRCDLLDKFGKGEEVEVTFNLKGRPYEKEGKTTYFTNLEAWRIEAIKGSETTPQDVKTGGVSKDFVESTNVESDDLPF